jgi:hypothetical protein
LPADAVGDLGKSGGQTAQTSVGGNAYRSGSLAQHRGSGLSVEIHDHSQQDCFGLVTRQAGNKRNSRLGRGRRYSLIARIDAVRGQLSQVLDRGCHRRAPFVVTQMIERPMPGYGCGPTTKPMRIAQSRQIPNDLQPCLGGDILGIHADKPPQIPQQTRLDGHVKGVESRRVTTLRRNDT